MTLNDVKEWLDEFICLLEQNPPDTTSKRIKENRRLCSLPYLKREEIKAWVQANKPAALPHLVELKTLVEDYHNYFNHGFKPASKKTIDEIPQLLLAKLRWIREKIEAL